MGSILESWSDAAASLGVELRGPFTFEVDQGRVIEAPMHVPHFGAPQGTVVFTTHQPLEHYAALKAAGFTASTFGEIPDGLIASEATLTEVLSDWGWCGPDSQRPEWLD